MYRTGIILVLALANSAVAQERNVAFSSDPFLTEAGLWEYVLPRFRLKTQITVNLGVEPHEVSVVSDSEVGAFADAEGQKYRVSIEQGSDDAQRFFDWLTSDIGLNTITSYQPDGQQIFFVADPVEVEEVVLNLPGDADLGKIAARLHCGRCHVVSEENRFGGISSTPSFMALRTMDDWYEKFEVFWTLNPHPVFVQIDEITPDFDPNIPSSIHPVYLTLDDVDNIGAYLATVPPADLGAPIETR